MNYVFKGLGIAAVLVLAFLYWQFTSVARGYRKVRKRVAQHVDPIIEKLSNGIAPTAEEVDGVAKIPYARRSLYHVLKDFERLDLFPEDYRTEEAQAVACLTHWMMHPNELEDPPEAMEFVERIDRDVGGEGCRFYVFRYRMAEGHWAGNDWLLGLSGPFIDNEPPYEGPQSGFSRFGDKYGQTNIDELIDWYVGMLIRHFG